MDGLPLCGPSPQLPFKIFLPLPSTIKDDSARTNGQGTSVKSTVSLSVVISSPTFSSYYYKL